MQLAHSPSVASRRQLPPGGSLSYCTAQPHGSRLLRWRLSRGTARSRTDSQRESQEMVRPREAHAGKSAPDKYNTARNGGSPEGLAVNELNSDTPSGPLCFFLRPEKEELSQQTCYILIRYNQYTIPRLSPSPQHKKPQACRDLRFRYLHDGK